MSQRHETVHARLVAQLLGDEPGADE